ncbi:MAG TPA: Mur ligase family protein, partial [Thermoanaerobaculia bacterium]|nr:Mur ligase family protein [Thermoanaerobaculia bacterium]
MKLAELIAGMETFAVRGVEDVLVESIAADSRMVQKGSLFVAIPGLKADGAEFIETAVRKGAVAIITEKRDLQSSVTIVEVPNARAALALAAARFYRHPADRLSLIGVTGTSGKTTTTKMIESVLDQTGEPAGLIGTIEYRAGGIREIADRTTPDAIVLQQWLARMVDERVRYAVMEVSSHALALKRTHGVRFAAGVFTNLSRDHFDFHTDFEDYYAA